MKKLWMSHMRRERGTNGPTGGGKATYDLFSVGFVNDRDILLVLDGHDKAHGGVNGSETPARLPGCPAASQCRVKPAACAGCSESSLQRVPGGRCQKAGVKLDCHYT